MVLPQCYAYQNRQLDTTHECDVPQYIQQAQLMKLVDEDGVGYPMPPRTTLLANATEDKAVK